MVDYFNQYHAPEGQKLTYLNLKENHQGFGYGAVVCTNSSAGSAVISAVNRNIEEWREDGLRAINKKWFAPKENEAAFWEHWETELSRLRL